MRMAFKLHERFAQALWLFAALGLYLLIFFIPLPPKINFKGIQIIDEGIILTSCALIFFAFKKSGWGWKVLALALTLVIFTLPLLRLWEIAESNYSLVLGLLPWSDASGYYSDTISLLSGHSLGTFAGDRPLFPALLSCLLWITGENLKTALLIIAIINGLAAFMIACQVHSAFGSLSGVSILYLLQFFYRLFVGTTMTEQLGIPLGLLGVAFLLLGLQKDKILNFAIGIFISTLGLLARPGAFFIIPTMLLLGLLNLKNTRGISKNFVILLLCAVIFPWLINSGLRSNIAVKQSVSFGRYSYTLYAQAVGSDDWRQILYDHPELAALGEPQFSNETYKMALAEIIHNPYKLVISSIKAWRDLFFSFSFGFFSYIQTGNQIVTIIIQSIMILFLFLGLIFCWVNKNNNLYSFLLVAFSGIFLSAPFAPPINTLWMRAYAATIAIPAILACVGFSAIISKWNVYHPLSLTWFPKFEFLINAISITLIFGIIAGSLLIHAVTKPDPILKFKCPSSSIPIQFKLFNGAFVSIATNESGQLTNMPIVSARDFRKSLRAFPGVYSNFSTPLLDTVTPPVLFTYTRNQITGDFFWLIVPPELATHTTETILGCGKLISQDSPVLEIQSIQIAP